MSKKIRTTPSTEAVTTTAHEQISSALSCVCNISSESDDFQPAKIRYLKVESPVAMNSSTLSETCDRYGVSETVFAATFCCSTCKQHVYYY